jgi:hypothetical protein
MEDVGILSVFKELWFQDLTFYCEVYISFDNSSFSSLHSVSESSKVESLLGT